MQHIATGQVDEVRAVAVVVVAPVDAAHGADQPLHGILLYVGAADTVVVDAGHVANVSVIAGLRVIGVEGEGATDTTELIVGIDLAVVARYAGFADAVVALHHVGQVAQLAGVGVAGGVAVVMPAGVGFNRAIDPVLGAAYFASQSVVAQALALAFGIGLGD